MILSPQLLLPLINSGKIISNLSERELQNPEGVGFDLTLASLSKVGKGEGKLGVINRKTPPHEELVANASSYVLAADSAYIATTNEIFDLPIDMAANFYPRSTLFRSGIIFQASILPPGYIGPMSFSLINATDQLFEIELNSRFAHVVFMSVSGDVGLYRGQWQGGRISQPNDERQV